ncbi:hypothetical protein V6N13_084713 [Hibiscus sabdariffa]
MALRCVLNLFCFPKSLLEIPDLGSNRGRIVLDLRSASSALMNDKCINRRLLQVQVQAATTHWFMVSI